MNQVVSKELESYGSHGKMQAWRYPWNDGDESDAEKWTPSY